MKASELRIGNYLDFEYGEPNERTFGFFSEIEDATSLLYIEEGKFKCQPIPLTAEILENCGLVRTVSNFYRFKNEDTCDPKDAFRLSIRNTGETKFSYMHGYEGYLIGRHIEFLHELQNLYHVITGEELSITL